MMWELLSTILTPRIQLTPESTDVIHKIQSLFQKQQRKYLLSYKSTYDVFSVLVTLCNSSNRLYLCAESENIMQQAKCHRALK